MANLTTVEDLRLRALKLAGEVSDGTSDYDVFSEEANGIKAIDLINDLNKALHTGGLELDVSISEPFEWLRADEPELLTIIPPFETGTISLTNGSASGTLSSAPAAGLGSLKGHFLKVEGISQIYRIAAHTAAGTAVTLDMNYLDDTGTALTFKIIKLDYELTTPMSRTFGPLIVQKRQFDEDPIGEIPHLEFIEFNRQYPLLRLVEGTPTRYTVVKEVQGLLTLRMNRYPTADSLRVEVNYIPEAEELRVFDFLDADVNTTDEFITEADHRLKNGQLCQLTSTAALPTGFSVDTDYYVVERTEDKFKLSATKGGTAVDITAAASGGTHRLSSVPRVPMGNRKLLSDYALAYILLDKSDQRSANFLRTAQAQLQAIVNTSRRDKRSKSRDRGRLIPRLDDNYANLRRGPRLFDEII